MSLEKSKTVAFLGKDPVRCKIIVDNKYLQQLKNCKYRGCEISYEHEKDIKKTSKIWSNTGNYKQHTQKTFGPETFKNRST
jgi:deoxyribose-phosphate aldolase